MGGLLLFWLFLTSPFGLALVAYCAFGFVWLAMADLTGADGFMRRMRLGYPYDYYRREPVADYLG